MKVNGFWIKKKHKYNKKFPQSPESIQKYSSEYNGCKSVIKCIWQKLLIGNYQYKYLSYRLDIHDLQTKLFLKEVLFSLAVSMDANTENCQIYKI